MSKRLLILDNSSNCLDMAIRARLSGWDVQWYDRPRPDGMPRRAGEGMFKKIQDFSEIQRKWLDWADLIYLPDNVYWIDFLEPYRVKGYPILAPSSEAAKLELDRDAGQKAMKKAGMKIMESKAFFDYDDAIAFVKKNPKFLVSKPSGDANKALSYVASDAADLTYMLQRWKANPQLKSAAKKEGFILQERKYGVEMAVGGFFGPHGFGKYFYENWEYKKLMADDLGVNCFSEDTEVLTKRGWLKFDNVTMNDDIASYQPNDGSIFYEKPEKLHWIDYEGEMHHFKNRYMDILVTPTHQMWATRRKMDDWKFYNAKDVPCEFTTLHCGQSKLIGNDTFTLPEYIDGRGYKWPEIKIPMEIWASFLGLYLSEGSCGKHKIQIAQEPTHKKELMEDFIKQMPFNYRSFKHGFIINSVQLASYLKSFGLSNQKYVPDYIKHHSNEIVNLFLDAYLLGDGDVHEGRRRWHTGSWKMVSDIQEMLTLNNSTGVISTDSRPTMVSPLTGKVYDAQPVYSIEESTRKQTSLRKGQHTTEHYRGKIGCVTLSTTHIIFVRRNGRVIACGQTGEMGTLSRMVTKSKLAEMVLLPMEEQLHKLGYVGYIDNNCIIDDKGIPWPMEFTCRDGWPTKHNVTAHVKNEDTVQWMLDMVNGRDTMECVNGEVCVSVLIALPDFPYSKVTNKDLCGIPIRGADDIEHIHLSEAMMGIAPTMVGDKVVDMPGLVTCGDYTMVVTGTGGTISSARRDAYNAVKKVKIPNSMFYRPDIGAGRMKRQLPELHRLGFGKGLEF